MTEIDRHTQSAQVPEVNQGRAGRRHFLGKGMKAAPFFVTLASQPALGEICFTPSRSVSKNASPSQKGKDADCEGAESAGNYAAQQTPTKSNKAMVSNPAYSWPTSPKPTTPLHPTFYMGREEGVTKFTKIENRQEVSQTFGEALNVNTGGQAHFHLIAAYLNCMGGNGAVIPERIMTPSRVLTIWQEYASKGYYEPTAGVKWYAKDIVDYLTLNGIVG